MSSLIDLLDAPQPRRELLDAQRQRQRPRHDQIV